MFNGQIRIFVFRIERKIFFKRKSKKKQFRGEKKQIREFIEI
jgi:hypothetical protein